MSTKRIKKSAGLSPEEAATRAAFKEKIQSISFVGRGKTSRFKQITSDQKYEIEKDGGEFT